MILLGDLNLLVTQGALFMKKIVLAMSTAAVFSVANAGSMGPVSMASYTPYLTGEASYTWPQINNPTVNGNSVSSTQQGWGGRLGGGMMYGYSEKLSFTGEIGGGYYGSTNRNIYAPITKAKVGSSNVSIDGYDMLAGLVYKWNYFDVFLQGGFMLQNLRYSENIDTALAVPGGSMRGTASMNGDHTQAYPEIKVGGIYNINPNWGVDVAYMHVFGKTPSVTGNVYTAGGVYYDNTSVVAQNPTLDSVMFGLHYNFVM
jgi:hypothetical protein